MLPGNRCLVSTLPGSLNKKLEIYTHTHTRIHAHTAVRVVVDVLLVWGAALLLPLFLSAHLLNSDQFFLQHYGTQRVNAAAEVSQEEKKCSAAGLELWSKVV